eukprot:364096-Chlamydomonas_euryale.AAC.10
MAASVSPVTSVHEDLIMPRLFCVDRDPQGLGFPSSRLSRGLPGRAGGSGSHHLVTPSPTTSASSRI